VCGGAVVVAGVELRFHSLGNFGGVVFVPLSAGPRENFLSTSSH
jgi:hypothetical protein